MISSLNDILGEKFVSNKPLDIMAYSYDSSDIISQPSVVVWPGTPDEIRRIVLYCNRTNTSLTVRGRATNVTGGAVANKSIIMDMSRLNKLYKTDYQNKEIDVEPGIILMSLNNYLAKEGFEFPIYPYFNRHRTLGGMAAMNTMGSRSFKLGRFSDWIKNVEYIDGTAKYYVIREGLNRVIGREGTTGIIIRMKLRISEKITDTSATIIGTDNLPQLFAKIQELKKEFDVLSIDYLNRASSTLMGLEAQNHIIVEYLTKKGEIKGPELNIALNKREKIFDILRTKEYYYIEDVSGSFESLYDMLSWAEEQDIPVFGPVGMGSLFLMFRKNEDEKLSGYYNKLNSLGMSSGTLLGYGLQKKRFVSGEIKKEFIKLKEEHDYNNILNRGKIVDFR